MQHQNWSCMEVKVTKGVDRYGIEINDCMQGC